MDATKAISGCKAKITLNAVDISGESNSYNLTPSRAVEEIASFGVCAEQKKPGLKSFSGSVDAFFTQDTTNAQETIWTAFELDTSVEFTISQGGGQVGDVEWGGNITITEMPMDGAPTDGPQTISFSFEGDGLLTRTVVA